MSRSHHQDQINGQKVKMSRSHHQDQINEQKVQDVKIAPLNGPKNDQISRFQSLKSSRNYSCSPELPVSRSQPLNGPKVQISKRSQPLTKGGNTFTTFA